MVSHRSGEIRQPHFAHWPGWGSPECENFVPGAQSLNGDGQGSAYQPVAKRRMELRLLIPTGNDRAGWSIELALPPCRECRASITIDLGGRVQTLDMRSMLTPRRIGAELSTDSYRIVSFSGKPDPSYVDGVEKDCPGLPDYGAAAFAALGSGELKGFPRTYELRNSETFALLWREPISPDFPEELVVDRLPGRREWYLALVTIPDAPSPECVAWLRSFTGLPVAPPVPSIVPVWPFLTRHSSVNSIECAKAGVILLSAEMMPVEQQSRGPTMHAQSALGKRSATGVERSPAFFALKPEGIEAVRVAEANNQDIQTFLSFSFRPERHQTIPAVELVFATANGGRQIASLHQRKCAAIATEARILGLSLEYLSMPPGATGILRIEDSTGRSEIAISSGSTASPHNRHADLPPPDVLTKLAKALANSACTVEIAFGGLGRLWLGGTWTPAIADERQTELPPELRCRLLSFLCQLQPMSPTAIGINDYVLVRALTTINLSPSITPHYRSLVKDILTCGFKL